MTNSSFQIQTDLSPWTIGDFEILVNNQNTIVATNPGQFYYHQRVFNDNMGNATASVDFEFNWDRTSFRRSRWQPIHAYVRLAGSNTWTDWTPQSTHELLERDPEHMRRRLRRLDHGQQRAGERRGLGHRPPRPPMQGQVLHVCCFPNDPLKKPATYSFTSKATVKVGGMPVSESDTSASLIGRGKKVTMAYGALTNKTTGLPIADVWVRVSQGSTQRDRPDGRRRVLHPL